jgi:hypothetical protein
MWRIRAFVFLTLLEASTAHASFNGPICRGGWDNLPCYAIWAAVISPFWLAARYEPYLGWFVLAFAFYALRPAVPLAIGAATVVTALAHYFGVLYGLLEDRRTQQLYPVAFWSSAAALGLAAALGIAWMARRPAYRAITES